MRLIGSMILACVNLIGQIFRAPQTKRALQRLEPIQQTFTETCERMGDAVKDAMLDWTPDEDEEAECFKEPLPPLSREAFVEALRGPAEEMLSALADAINEVPDAATILAGSERCEEVLGDFFEEALQCGVKLRVDAATAELPTLPTSLPRRHRKKWSEGSPPASRPHFDWVKKFRRMKATEGELPVSKRQGDKGTRGQGDKMS
jgi:hypothetical protein